MGVKDLEDLKKLAMLRSQIDGISVQSIMSTEFPTVSSDDRIADVLAVMKDTSEHVLSLHAFHVHFDTHMVHFDVVVDFKVRNYVELTRRLTDALTARWPEYTFEFTIDPEYD